MAWRGSNHLLVTRRGIYRFEPRESHRARAKCKLSSVLGRLIKFRPNKNLFRPGILSYTFLVYYKDSSIIYIKKIFAYNYFKKILNYEKKTKIIGLKILKPYML